MKKKIFFVIFIVFFILVIIFLINGNVHEKVYENTTIISGDELTENMNSYDIYVTDDTITFNDPNGNSIIYAFENDRLANVFNVYNAENEVEAKKIAAYFMGRINDGEILKVDYRDNIVSVQMDMNYFSDYKDYSMKEIEKILLQTSE